MADEEGQEGGSDPRLDFLQQYTLKTMKQKNDKWSKVFKKSLCTLIYGLTR